MRERLQGLAETHVIGEHTAETALAQQLQPGQAFVLIAAQLGLQAIRHSQRGAGRTQLRAPVVRGIDAATLQIGTTAEVVEQHTRPARQAQRSEEHTSELQSLMRISYAVFCLKKKK